MGLRRHLRLLLSTEVREAILLRLLLLHLHLRLGRRGLRGLLRWHTVKVGIERRRLLLQLLLLLRLLGHLIKVRLEPLLGGGWLGHIVKVGIECCR